MQLEGMVLTAGKVEGAHNCTSPVSLKSLSTTHPSTGDRRMLSHSQMCEGGACTLCIVYGMVQSGSRCKGRETNESLSLPYVHKREQKPNLPRRKSCLRKQRMQCCAP